MAWIFVSWIFFKLVMFIFCLCDVGYWIRVNTVQKVKRKNMLPKYVGSFSAEVRTVYFFQVSSPFRVILRRNSEDCKTFKQATGTMIPLVYVGSI